MSGTSLLSLATRVPAAVSSSPWCPIAQHRDHLWVLTGVWGAVLSHSSHVQFFVTLWTVAHQAPLSMGFSRREYWSGLPCPPRWDLPDPGIKPASLCLPHWQVGSPVCARAGPVLCCAFMSMGSWDSSECPSILAWMTHSPGPGSQ